MKTVITVTTNQPSVILWQENEQPVNFVRYNGNLVLQQGSNEIIVSDDDFAGFVKAAKLANKMSWER